MHGTCTFNVAAEKVYAKNNDDHNLTDNNDDHNGQFWLRVFDKIT